MPTPQGHIYDPVLLEDGLPKHATPLLDQGVETYAGFTEHVYRLLFDYEDHFKTEPTVKTILPSGASEASKVCKPVKGKALVGYTFTQNISEVAAMQHGTDPCVWRRTDGSFAVVQVWSTNYNDEFKQTFEVTTANSDSSKFSPEAVREFHEAMIGIFGDAARERSVLFCSKATENNNTVYVGNSEELFNMLLSNPSVRQSLNLEKILSDGFVARVLNKKGETSTKAFTLSPGVKYALYTKVGYDTMACATPFDLFIDNRVLHEERGEAWMTNVSVEDLPAWLCREDVKALDEKFKDSCKTQGKWPTPLPMHMVAGPALKWAWIACGILWLAVLTMFLSEYYFGYCQDGAWVSPRWIWAVLVIFAIGRLFCEYQALCYFFLPYAQESRRLFSMPCNGGMGSPYHFKLPMLGSVSARAWLAFHLLRSINNIVDPGFDGISVATIMRNPECGEREFQHQLWAELMGASMFGKVLGPTTWDKISLPTLALVSFIFLFAQLLYPVFACTVFRTKEERAKNGPVDFKLHERPEVEVRWTTPARRCRPNSWKATYHESLQIVGFAAGMASVQAMFPELAIAQVKVLLNDERDGYELRIVRRAKIILNLTMNMMLLQMLLENSFSLQVQSVAFFCHWNYSHKIQYTLVVSILTSTLAVALEVVALGMPTLRITWGVCRHVQKRLWEGLVSTKQDDNTPYNELVSEELWSVRQLSLFVIIIKLSCLAAVTYSMLRMMFNFFVCKDGLWNMNGCVTLSNF